MRIEATQISTRNLGRDRWLGRAALVLLWAFGVTYLAASASAGALAVCGVPFFLLAGTSLILGLNHGRSVAGSRTSGALGRVLIQGDTLEVHTRGGVQKWPLAELVSGWSERLSVGERVVLATRSGLFVSFLVPPSQRARDVLQAAGVAPDQRAVVIRLGVQEPGLSRVVMIFLSMILGMLLLSLVPLVVWMVASSLFGGANVPWTIPIMISLVGTLAGAILYTGLLRPLVPSTLRIGTDGVSIERLFRRRLLRRKEIDRVIAGDRQVEIWRRAGGVVRIPAASAEETQAVAACIEDTLAEVTADDVRPVLLDKLDRGGRPLDAWLRELRAFARASSGYRDTAGGPDELLGIAKSGAAPAERRIAAAAVLAEQGDPKVRIEVHAAAAACADERLRVALEKAAEGQIEEEYLESLAEQEAARAVVSAQSEQAGSVGVGA